MDFECLHFRAPSQIAPRDADRSNILGRCGNWLEIVFAISQHKDPVDSLVCMYEVSEPEAKAILDDFIAEMHGEGPGDG